MPGQLVDLADEHRGDQEQRDQGGGAEPVVDDQRDPDQRRSRRARRAAACRCAGRSGSRAPSTTANRSWTAAASSVQRRTTWAWPRLARRSSRPATPSSIAAAWSVHAISSSTLRAESCGEQRPDHGQRGDPGQREQEERRPPRRTRRRSTADRTPAAVRIACQALCRSRAPTSWVSSSTRSSTSPTACSVSAASGWCSAASRRSARSRPSARSTTPAHTVRATVSKQGAADDAQRRAARPAGCVASSARRPATSEPSEVPTAPTAQAASAQKATGPRSRRQSTVRSGSDGGGGVWWSGAAVDLRERHRGGTLRGHRRHAVARVSAGRAAQASPAASTAATSRSRNS